jgi:hypothetical protein
MPDFWPSCGYRLLQQTPDGQLSVTDDFLRSFLLRPELAPVAESCPAELALHDALLAAPRCHVSPQQTQALEDPDARENYEIFVRLRERLAGAPSLEAAYLGLFAGAGADVPTLFVHQLTQILLRHILTEEAQPLHARAAEMLFRPQQIARQGEFGVLAADQTTVEVFSLAGGFDSSGALRAMNQIPAPTIEVDELTPANASGYWQRDERFDCSLRLDPGSPGLDALMRVLERWIAHFLAVQVTIRPQGPRTEHKWAWHVGLDAQASELLNDLYNAVESDEARMRLLLGLFRLDFADPAVMRPAIAGQPVYLALAMDTQNRLRMKPQNLLFNLPLARLQ